MALQAKYLVEPSDSKWTWLSNSVTLDFKEVVLAGWKLEFEVAIS